MGELLAAIEAMWHDAFGGMAAAIDQEQEGMTIARFPVLPIVKAVRVRAAPDRVFALFAEDFGLVVIGAGAHRPRSG